MSSLKLQGATSGEITVTVPSVSGTNTLTLPANTGTLMTSTYTSGDVDIDSGTLHVDATNNRVGIGTSSPAHNVEIVATASGSVNDTLQIRNNATDTGTGSRIRFINSTDANSDANGASIASIRTGGDNDLTFETENAERMRIDSSGNVLVGTTTRSGSEKVTIAQSSNAVGISVRSNSGPALGNYESSDNTHATYWTFGRDNQLTGNYVFANGGTLRGSINGATGTYSASSDSRLKKNITNITYGLNEVMAFRPVTYLMNEEDDTAKKHLGFIAQEVKTLVDEAVDDLIDPDTQFYMLDKSGLVPVLVRAIQEQQEQIKALETRIQALENA